MTQGAAYLNSLNGGVGLLLVLTVLVMKPSNRENVPLVLFKVGSIKLPPNVTSKLAFLSVEAGVILALTVLFTSKL